MKFELNSPISLSELLILTVTQHLWCTKFYLLVWNCFNKKKIIFLLTNLPAFSSIFKNCVLSTYDNIIPEKNISYQNQKMTWSFVISSVQPLCLFSLVQVFPMQVSNCLSLFFLLLGISSILLLSTICVLSKIYKVFQSVQSFNINKIIAYLGKYHLSPLQSTEGLHAPTPASLALFKMLCKILFWVCHQLLHHILLNHNHYLKSTFHKWF